jgi:hypothetical protein
MTLVEGGLPLFIMSSCHRVAPEAMCALLKRAMTPVLTVKRMITK